MNGLLVAALVCGLIALALYLAALVWILVRRREERGVASRPGRAHAVAPSLRRPATTVASRSG